MTAFTTAYEARAAIIDIIEATGVIQDAAAEFDLDAIAGELVLFRDGYDADRAAYITNAAGYEIDEDADFWGIVEANAL